MNPKKLFLAICLAASTCIVFAQSNWKETLKREMPVMGHRNWLVVADSAYPEQVSPGVITLYTGESQEAVLKYVLTMLSHQRHVRPEVFMDSELKNLTDDLAPGIGGYKRRVNAILAGRPVSRMLHEKLISTLDESGKTFRVIILKTNLTLPYTSVFFRLNCAYWSDANEAKLRAKMGGG